MSSELDSWSCTTISIATSSTHSSEAHLAVHSGIETMSPAVTVIPIEVAPHGEESVLGAGVGNISHKCVDVVGVCLGPFWVQLADGRRCQNMIAVVEVVIIVVGIAKVD